MRPLDPIPVSALLVPPLTAQAPAGFTVVDQPIAGALPLRIPLFADLALVAVVPTGLGRQWRACAAADVVSTAAPERAPLDPSTPPAGAPQRPPARLYLERGRATVGVLPLAAGLRRLVAAGSDVLVEVVVLAWEIRADTVRGGGDVGSRITLAWRDASRAPAQFSPDPIHPRVVARRRLGGMTWA